MNSVTNEVMTNDCFKKLSEEAQSGFEELPDDLQYSAKKKLAGRESCFVSKTSGGRLSRWAASKRKKKRQTAKASRRASMQKA